MLNQGISQPTELTKDLCVVPANEHLDGCVCSTVLLVYPNMKAIGTEFTVLRVSRFCTWVDIFTSF